MLHQIQIDNPWTYFRWRWWAMLLFISAILIPGRPAVSYPESAAHLESLIGPRDALLVAAPDNRTIVSKNTDSLLIPASTLKLFTSLVALHYLGPDYRFSTEFYLNRHNTLIIKGYGDPLFISEQVDQAAAQIARLRIPFSAIGVDNSYFSGSLQIPGVSNTTQPYDSHNGALCVNFNTVCFSRINGRFVSDEPQTPLLPYAIKRIRMAGVDKGRIRLSSDEQEGAIYAGHLFRHFSTQHGGPFIRDVAPIRIEKNHDTLIYTHVSDFTLSDIISKLLEFSNNYIANQVLISTGAQVFGPPGTLEKGIRTAQTYARDVLEITDITLAEGSGISRNNRISAIAMNRILNEFEPWHQLMRHEGDDYYKTGTLSGIRTRAGYIQTRSGELYRFVVLLNSPQKSCDSIMKAIHRLVDADSTRTKTR
ncbi:MAG: D-alanyl-D-alanine carboxypeptidase [Desulfobacterales bacterium]|nr:D-alanyl-D-alanine carboxypeptidase [Desulfobacterales bacterium]MDD4072051.1 D-alanyl-D-alanine carboxypeptidase [Desulfobacterales bacterium]MDD4394001.1 D-alanyl-D-alanine carboxypeptidase [Desulfobacterales bacterium]